MHLDGRKTFEGEVNICFELLEVFEVRLTAKGKKLQLYLYANATMRKQSDLNMDQLIKKMDSMILRPLKIKNSTQGMPLKAQRQAKATHADIWISDTYDESGQLDGEDEGAEQIRNGKDGEYMS